MLSMYILSCGYMEDIWRAQEKMYMMMSCVRCSREQLYSSFLSNFQISQVHPYLDTHNYNIATTTWVLKHVLFVITCSYKSQFTVKENNGSYTLVKNMPHSVRTTVVRKRYIWFIKLSMKNLLLSINKNVGKQSQNTQ